MNDAIFYISKPCRKCGGVERYKSNNLCPVCRVECNRRYKARKAKAEGRKYKPRETLQETPPTSKVKTVSHTERALKTMVKVLLGMFVNER